MSIPKHLEWWGETKAEQCKAMEMSSISHEVLASVAEASSSIPIIGGFGAAVAMGNKIRKGRLDLAMVAMDCSDVPFDEIKDILNEKFQEMDRKLDKNTEVLKGISDMVSKTLSEIERSRREMSEGFKNVLVSIRNSRVEPVVGKINHFIDYFEREKKTMSSFQKGVYITKLEDPLFLSYLQESGTPSSDSLSSNLNAIIEEKFAIPQNDDDTLAFSALYALFYGTQAYVEVMYFLIDKYTYLAEYYYQKRDFEKYNKYFDSIITNFNYFKYSLIGTRKTVGLISKVLEVYEIVESKISDDSRQKELIVQIEYLEEVQKNIKDMDLDVVEEIPQTVQRISFDLDIQPVGDWKNGNSVKYAVQYQKNNSYSKLSEWAEFKIYEKSNPKLVLLNGERGMKRLIFRQIDNRTPQLIGKANWKPIEFEDINRDLYNSAKDVHKDIAFNEVKLLVEKKADINAVFDNGRQVIHAAAMSDNAEIVLNFLIEANKNVISEQDEMGYAPLHVAINAKSETFLSMLLDKGAKVNSETNEGLTPLHLAAKLGLRKIARKLIKSDKIDINKKDKYGYTPLHYAVMSDSKIVESLVSEDGISLNEKTTLQYTPFHLAVLNNNINHFEEVLTALQKNQKLDVNVGGDNHMTGLHLACMEGNVEKVRLLLKLPGIDVNSKLDDNNFTPLHSALDSRNVPVCFELLKVEGIDVNAPDSANITPLHLAVASGLLDLIKELMVKGANVEAVTDEGFTLYHTAAMRKEKGLMDLIPLPDTSINGKTEKGLTPLHLAVSVNNIESSKFLLKKNADIEATTNEGLTPLHLAIDKESWDCVFFLLKNNANVRAKTKKDMTPLHFAISKDNEELVKLLLGKKVNIEDKTDKGLTPLHLALSKDKLKFARLLIEKKADIKSKTYHDKTPLHYAAEIKSLDMMKYLIENGADVNARTFMGLTPFHIVASNGQIEAFEYLKEKEAALNIVDKIGNIFFYSSVKNGHLNFIKYCIDNQIIELNTVDNQRLTDEKHKTIAYYAVCDAIRAGRLYVVKYLVGTLGYKLCNPVYQAATSGNFDMLKFFVETGRMEINRVYGNDDHSHLPLLGAIFQNHMDIVEYLVNRGADVNKCHIYSHEHNALIFAISKNRPDIVEYLVTNKADTEVTLFDEETVIHVSARHSFESLKYFLERNTYKINAQDKSGDTALHKAVLQDGFSDQEKIVKYLCSKGADVAIRNNANQTAYDIAESKGLGLAFSCLDPNKLFFAKRQFEYETSLSIKSTEDQHDRMIPLRLPVGKGNFKNAEKFLKRRAVNNNTKNPLYNAAISGELAMVKSLVEEQHMNINQLYDDDSRHLPLLGAISEGYFDIVKYLVNAGADVNKCYVQNINENALTLAILDDNVDMVKYLVENNARLDTTLANGGTLIHLASVAVYSLKYLLNISTNNINSVDIHGNTPLHRAILNSKIGDRAEIVKYLCDKGADITIRNKKNELAYDLAKVDGSGNSYDCLKPGAYMRLKRTDFKLKVNKDSETEYKSPLNSPGENSKIFPDHEKFDSSLREQSLGENTSIHGAIGLVKIAPESNHSSLQSIGKTAETEIPVEFLNDHLTVNGSLLLLSVLLNSVTNQKYKSTGNESMSENEVQARALDVVANFEKFLSSMSDAPSAEEIDLSKVHADVFKAIYSDNEREIPNILNSHVKSLSRVKSKDINTLMSKLMTTN